jgi:hypothetical protein
MPRTKINVKSKIDTYLTTIEYQKFMSLCAERKATKSDIAREAIRFYLEHLDKAKAKKNESEVSQCIKSMTDRICGMLARQGTQTGILFELAWQNHVENNMQDRFVSATNLVKSNLRKRLEQDEKDIASRMQGVVEK